MGTTTTTIQLLATQYTRTSTDVSVTNPANAYTDTSSTTYAEVSANSSGAGLAYFSGFDFSQIPSGATNITMTFKVKVKATISTVRYYVGLYDSSTGDALSATTQTTSTATTHTLTLSSLPFADVIALGDNFAFGVSKYASNVTQSVYGMEVNVTYEIEPKKNKVIYNGNTLIDLTGDTATKEDVALGKLFHLANGEQATGTGGGDSVGNVTKTQGSSTVSSISFTLDGEPKTFYMMMASSIGPPSSNTAICAGYDGTNSYGAYYSYSSGLQTTSVTFTYSSGTLTMSLGNRSQFIRNNTYRLIYTY